MEWYVPLTIIPGISLIILSTSNIMLALNNEIYKLGFEKNRMEEIIKLKLLQLKRVSISIVFQYVGVLLFLFSGILQTVFSTPENLSRWLLFTGVLSISISIIILLIYSIKAVTIKQKHLKL